MGAKVFLKPINRVVVFNKNNSRTISGVSFLKAMRMRTWANAMVNPDLSAVSGKPPHHWKIQYDSKGKKSVTFMDAEEMDIRDRHIKKFGADNSLDKSKESSSLLSFVFGFGLGSSIFYLSPLFLKKLSYLVNKT